MKIWKKIALQSIIQCVQKVKIYASDQISDTFIFFLKEKLSKFPRHGVGVFSYMTDLSEKQAASKKTTTTTTTWNQGGGGVFEPS